MRLSIRLRTVLALNAFVIGLTVVLGWIAQDVAGKVVEERFVKEMVSSAAGFLKRQSFPRSYAMMTYLRQLFNAEWIAIENDGARTAGSSLPEALSEQFREQVGGAEPPSVMSLGSQRYRVDWADLDLREPPAAPSAHGRLYMLVPNTQFQHTRARAQAEVSRVIGPAAIIATLLGIVLSVSITRPIRRLASEMDRLEDTEDTAGVLRSRPAARKPIEIAQLESSFYRLLDRLSTARRQIARNEQLAMLGRVCLSVAHELRNPLSGIKMNVRVLQDREEIRDDPGVAAILREIDRMELYLSDLMGLAAGGDRPARALVRMPQKLSHLAEGALAILAGRCRHARITMEREYAAAEPSVAVDGGQIRQVMMNLMTNAIEAMPAGGTLTVSLRCLAGGVRFCVADTGKGVEPGAADVFEAFTSGKPNGVGLGLYICKQIITAHGGTIGYDSSAEGAAFWFELPIDDDATDGGSTGTPRDEGTAS